MNWKPVFVALLVAPVLAGQAADQFYPGNRFDYHLIPFKAALDAGTGGIMTAYGIPVGKDTVGIAFSKAMVNELLRRKMGFQGLW